MGQPDSYKSPAETKFIWYIPFLTEATAFKIAKNSVPFLIVVPETMTFWRFYVRYDNVWTMECLLNFFVCLFFTVMIGWSWHTAVNSDPGFQPPSEEVKKSEPQCARCNAIRLNDTIHHCRKCGKCVDGMDHHCIWTNNCVGVNNRKAFVLFTFYSIGMSTFGVSTIVLHFLSTNQIH